MSHGKRSTPRDVHPHGLETTPPYLLQPFGLFFIHEAGFEAGRRLTFLPARRLHVVLDLFPLRNCNPLRTLAWASRAGERSISFNLSSGLGEGASWRDAELCPSFTVVSLCRVFVHTTSITTTGYRHITKSEERTEQCKTKSKHTGARGASSKPNRLELITYMYLWSNLPSEPRSKMLYAMRKILVIYLVGPCVAMP